MINSPYIVDTGGEGIDRRIVAFYNSNSYICEEYRILRTNIFGLKRSSGLTLVITSSLFREGKTITAINLALTLAKEPGLKVLLIDSNLRDPMVHSFLGIDSEPGLTDLLLGNRDVQAKRIEDLSVLPAGRRVLNPSELLNSSEMETLIKKWQGQYDYLILDSPPVISYTDAGILSGLCEGVILVVAAFKTQKNAILHAKYLLDNVKANVLGFVLTQTESFIPKILKHHHHKF
ncbi:MAG: CpsD/CapB family tyrosine-protein kinase [Candidatus Desantisbacteria bacterium]